MKRILYFGLCLVMLIATASACTPAPTAAPASPTNPPAAQPTTAPAAPSGSTGDAEKFGGTLTISEGAIKQFDPIYCSDDPSFHGISQIFSFLFRVYQGEVIPDLATSWDFQEDGKVVIFHLRQGVMFHDDNEVFAKGQSREVVADDVVYSIKRLVELKDSLVFPDLKDAYQNIETVDKYTVKLTLKTPDALLFMNARGLSNGGIVPKEAIDKLGDKFAQNPVGSGPFKFSEYKPDDHLTLVRNDLYWKKPYLDKVVYKIIPDDNTSIMSLQSGEVDVAGLPSAEFSNFNGNDKYNLLPVKTCPVATQLNFNTKDAPYNDKQFRQAISYAIDGQAIGKNVVKEMYVEGCGTAGPGVPGYDKDLCKYFVYDPQKSKDLLDQLGYKVGADGMRTDKDGKPMKLELEIWSMAPMPQYGAALVTQLKDVGLNVELQTVEFGTFIDDWNSGPNKMMTMNGWCGDGGTNGFWGRSGWMPKLGFNEEQVFTLLEQSNQIVDAAKRDETIRQAADLIYGNYYGIPLGFEYFYQITNTKVQDFPSFLWFENIVTEKNNVWLKK